MKHNNFFIRILAVLGVAAVIFCSLSLGVFASENDFVFNVNSDKSEYQIGEQIKFDATLNNSSFKSYKNVVVSVEVPESDRYFLSKNDREYPIYLFGESKDMEFIVVEDETIISIGRILSSISVVLSGIFGFLIWKYNKLCTIYVTLSLIATTVFSAFPSSLTHLTADRERVDLGTCSVVYDGEQYEFGFFATYEKQENIEVNVEKLTDCAQSYSFEADIKVTDKGPVGLVFGADIEENMFSGCLFYVDVAEGKTGIFYREKNDGENFIVADKNITVKSGETYKMKVCHDGNRIKCYLYDNLLDTDPYPVFDVEGELKGHEVGFLLNKDSSYSNEKVVPYDMYEDAETYMNPVLNGVADPYVLTYEGKYYLYGTTDANEGFEVFVSADLVHWENGGFVARNKDIAGNFGFWAPEVYYYNGMFYMFYTAEEHTCIATASSPYGPFVSEKDEFFIDGYKNIDSSLFFDDDGKIYMYFSRITDKNMQLWGCEMNEDLMSYKADTFTHLTTPVGWEVTVNEGPTMLKNNGTYYLTYSGEGFTSINYGSAYATSDKPLGEFTKYEDNPIIDSNIFIRGTAHHCFAKSPDGTEMFIIYHCHNTPTQVGPRHTCIDRVKFVPTESGVDKLVVYGPTMTAQPVPSNTK